MKKQTTSKKKVASTKTKIPALPPMEASFAEVVELIEKSRQKAYHAVNTALIDLYWQVGEYISHKLQSAEWGDGVVDELARYIVKTQPNLRGFTRASLFRMRQFYETYAGNEIVAPAVRQLSWSHHLIILGQCKRPEEREFYLRLASQERWSKRELERQIKAAYFERAVLNPPKASAALRQIHPEAEAIFKDSYLLEFLGLTAEHSEADLHSGLLRCLGRFLTELGRDFCFVGSEYPLQVGGRDFALDLLFFHRGLNCLIAIELKAGRFEPEYLGKLEFYLEALDRDVRKPHERPSIGVLLCATKDSEVVEYALSRSLSPALIAEYQAMLPDKKVLQAKLQEFYQLLAPPDTEAETTASSRAPKLRRHKIYGHDRRPRA
jgi:predicted nuclease of restriction endonuclease-like (RecB) superfamily